MGNKVLLLAVLAVGLCGCAHVNYYPDGATSPYDCNFFKAMEAGYEKTFPDQEEVFFSKGFVSVEGQKYATFAWRDDKGTLNVVLNGEANIPIQKYSSVIWIKRVGPEMLGEGQVWINDRELMQPPFTWVAISKSPEDPEKAFQEVRRLKGLKKVDLIAFQR